GLSRTFRDDPVFDADVFAGEAARPACNIAGSEDARDVGFKIFVHRNAAIGGEPQLFRQCDHRSYANTDDDEIGLQRLSVLQANAVLFYGNDGGTKTEPHTVALVQL